MSGTVQGMTKSQVNQMIRRAIADDELWIAKARALITSDSDCSDSDCSSIEQSIAKAQAQVDRMRALL